MEETIATDTAGRNPNITVAVRIRPQTQEEARREYHTIVSCVDERVVVFDPADPNKTANRGAPHNRTRAKDLKFGFDRVFDPYASQFEVFQHTTRHLINEVLDGYNCTCFAYGATGAGKTHTMIGNAGQPGVMVLTMKELFAAIDSTKSEKQYEISISYIEIYNETIRDLLVPNSKQLELRESAECGVQIAGLSFHNPKSADEVLQMLEVGNTRRCQSPTQANAQSSRSHAVFQIIVQQRDKAVGINADFKTGKLSLIDLAGSERASRTKNKGQQLVEGANINKSLLALGNCINALGQDWKEGKYVPYRNSKLTRLLKDSLGGNSKTVMIANISPSSLSYEDTYNTLNYANRAKNIKTKVQTNVLNVTFHVTQYRTLIEDLKMENAELKAKIQHFELVKGPVVLKKEAENAATEEMRAQIAHTIKDRMAMQKHLEALELKDMQHFEEKQSKILLLQQYERELEEASPESPAIDLLPESIAALRQGIEELVKCQQDNREARSTLLNRLFRNSEETKRLHDLLPGATAIPDTTRKLFESDLGLHYQELEKLNLVLHMRQNQHTIRVMKDKQSQMHDLLRTMRSLLSAQGLMTSALESKLNDSLPNSSKSQTSSVVSSVAKFEVDPPSPFMKASYAPSVADPAMLQQFRSFTVSTASTSTATATATSSSRLGPLVTLSSGTSPARSFKPSSVRQSLLAMMNEDAEAPHSSALVDKENDITAQDMQALDTYASAVTRRVNEQPKQVTTKPALKKPIPPQHSIIAKPPARTNHTAHGAAKRVTPVKGTTMRAPGRIPPPSRTPSKIKGGAVSSTPTRGGQSRPSVIRRAPPTRPATATAPASVANQPTATYNRSPFKFTGAVNAFNLMMTPVRGGGGGSGAAGPTIPQSPSRTSSGARDQSPGGLNRKQARWFDDGEPLNVH